MTRKYSAGKIRMSSFIHEPADLVALIQHAHDALFPPSLQKKSEAVDALRNLSSTDCQLRIKRVYAHPHTHDIHFEFFHENEMRLVSAYVCKVREQYRSIAAEEYQSVYLDAHLPSASSQEISFGM